MTTAAAKKAHLESVKDNVEQVLSRHLGDTFTELRTAERRKLVDALIEAASAKAPRSTETTSQAAQLEIPFPEDTLIVTELESYKTAPATKKVVERLVENEDEILTTSWGTTKELAERLTSLSLDGKRLPNAVAMKILAVTMAAKGISAATVTEFAETSNVPVTKGKGKAKKPSGTGIAGMKGGLGPLNCFNDIKKAYDVKVPEVSGKSFFCQTVGKGAPHEEALRVLAYNPSCPECTALRESSGNEQWCRHTHLIKTRDNEIRAFLALLGLEPTKVPDCLNVPSPVQRRAVPQAPKAVAKAPVVQPKVKPAAKVIVPIPSDDEASDEEAAAGDEEEEVVRANPVRRLRGA